MRAAAIALAAVLATGCATAFDQALRRAEAAGEAGDRIGAAIAYREACALQREGTDACARAEQAARAAIDDALAQARCEKVDAASCVEKLRAARELSPKDPALLAAIDAASDRHAERCGEVDGLESIIPVLGCLERIERQVNRPSFSRRIAERSRSAAALVAQLPSNTSGAALMVASLASCFGDSDARTRARASRRSFRRRSRCRCGRGPRCPGPASAQRICAPASRRLRSAIRRQRPRSTWRPTWVRPSIGWSRRPAQFATSRERPPCPTPPTQPPTRADKKSRCAPRSSPRSPTASATHSARP